jgi:hypothetical protein
MREPHGHNFVSAGDAEVGKDLLFAYAADAEIHRQARECDDELGTACPRGKAFDDLLKWRGLSIMFGAQARNCVDGVLKVSCGDRGFFHGGQNSLRIRDHEVNQPSPMIGRATSWNSNRQLSMTVPDPRAL